MIDKQRWRVILDTVFSLTYDRILPLVGPIVCHSSPEGYLPDEEGDQLPGNSLHYLTSWTIVQGIITGRRQPVTWCDVTTRKESSGTLLDTYCSVSLPAIDHLQYRSWLEVEAKIASLHHGRCMSHFPSSHLTHSTHYHYCINYYRNGVCNCVVCVIVLCV